MVLNAEKRARLAEVLYVRDNATTGNAGASARPASPASPGTWAFAPANSSSHEAELKTKKQQALADELARVKEQLANQAQSFFIRETALTQELGVLRKAELEANKRLHEEGQKYTILLNKVVPLHAEVVGLKEEVAANKAKMASLEERFVTREVHLGKVEAELSEKTKALEKIKGELTEQAKTLEKTKEEFAKKTEALVKAKEEMTAQAEDFEKAKAELLDDATDAYVVVSSRLRALTKVKVKAKVNVWWDPSRGPKGRKSTS